MVNKVVCVCVYMCVCVLSRQGHPGEPARWILNAPRLVDASALSPVTQTTQTVERTHESDRTQPPAPRFYAGCTSYRNPP